MVLSLRLVLLGTASLAAVGCDPAPRDGDPVALVATTSIWADIASNVACGAPVATIIPAGADPHSYEPSLRDREVVSSASVVVANGAGLEATTHDLLDAARSDGVTVVEVAAHTDLIDGDHDADHTDDEGHVDGHAHGDGDPHLWQDPTRVADVLDAIAAPLAASGFDTCAAAYRDEMLALDAEVAETLAAVPAADRLLVTSHDSLAYFAERYGFEVVGTVIPSTSTMAESSAGELAALAQLVEERSVRAIFTDEFESAGDAEALATRLGIRVVPLGTGALTDEAGTYADMMRSNAATIAEALTS